MTHNSIIGKNAKQLLLSNILFRSGTLVSQIFLNIFLFKNTWDIQLIALFNIILLIMNLVSMNIFARIVKKGYRNIIHVFALLWLSCVYGTLVLLGDSITNYYQILAVFIGLFSGMYWIVYNSNEFDLTHNKNRWNYQWLKKSFKTLSAIIVPSIIGSIIGINYLWYWYQSAFILGIVFLLSSACIGIVTIEYQEGNRYSIISAVKKLIHSKDLVKININSSLLWFSLSNPLIETIIPLLLFSYGVTEMKLGFLVSSFAFLTVITSYLYGKFIWYKHYKIAYILSGCVYMISVGILIFFPTYWYIILFSSLLTMLFSFMDIPQSVLSANKFNEISWHEKIKAEYMAIREWPLILWRVLAFSCIYFIGSFSQFGIQTLFWIMAVVIFMSMILLASMKIS